MNDYSGSRVKSKGKVKLTQIKYIMDLGNSLSYVSVNLLLHFYQLAPKNRIWIKLSHMNWEELMANAKKSHLIYKPNDSDLMQARTPSGMHLLWICAEDERTINPTSIELYKISLGLKLKFTIVQHMLRKLKSNHKLKYEA